MVSLWAGVGGASAEEERIRLEAQCLAPLHNSRPLAPGNPAPSTRKMAVELARMQAEADPAVVSFLSARRATEFEKAYAETLDVRRKLGLGLDLGMQQLNAGRPDFALETFSRLDMLASEAGGRLGQRTLESLRRYRAISFLRLGEQENCIGAHGPDSCLFPLVPAAFHKVERGSRKALEQLGGILKSNTNDLEAIWLMNVAHMTLGEYPDRVPEPWRIPPSAFESEFGMPRMPDVAGNLGLDINGLAGGVVADDFDGDGFLDLFLSEWSLDGQLRFFRNNGDGTFTERTSEAGLVGLTGGLQIVQTDYNNDGHPDLWIPRGAWIGKAGRFPQSLLRNNGDGTFTEVAEEAGLTTRHPSQSGCWFDYDGDGWLDLFKANESMDPSDPDWCELFHNNRDGTFTECAQASGIKVASFVKAATWADYDRDGRPDLYLSCRNSANILLHNDGPAKGTPGAWSFSQATAKAGVAEPIHSFPTWFFDYDNDGWEDLFVSGYRISGAGDIAAEYLGRPYTNSIPRMYRNLGDGRFQDVTKAVRMDRVCYTMGCAYGDLDNDGWLDFYLGTGDPELSTLIPNRMFRNDGGRRFLDVTAATGTGHLQKGHGVTFADLDNDGDQDIYTVIGGAYTGDVARNVLFQNPGGTNHWIKLRLSGTKANRAAIGARVHLTLQTPSGTRHLHRRVGAASSFGGSPLRLEIGLGNAVRVAELEIVWPGSGTQQRFTDLAMDVAYRIREDATAPEVEPLRPFQFPKTPNPKNAQIPTQRPAANGS